MAEIAQSLDPKPENPLTSFSTEFLAQELAQRLQTIPPSEYSQTLKAALDSFISESEKTNSPEASTQKPDQPKEVETSATSHEQPQSTTSESKQSLPEIKKSSEEIAKEYAALIREKGFAFLAGKFPLKLTTSTGEVISDDEDFGGFSKAGKIGIENTGDIGLLNMNHPYFESALSNNKKALNPKAHYFTSVSVPIDLLKGDVEQYNIKIGQRLQSVIDSDEGLVVYSLHSWEDSDSAQYSRVQGARANMDLPLKFYFALPESAIKDNYLTADSIWRIYEELYPGIENQLTRRPADHFIRIPEPFRYSGEKSDENNWIQYISDPNQCPRFKYSQTVGQAATVAQLK